MNLEKVTLSNICQGRAVEMFDRELATVLENISDPTTKIKEARKIVLEVTIVPSEDRSIGKATVKAHSKLAKRREADFSMDFVQEGRAQVAYQSSGRQGELDID